MTSRWLPSSIPLHRAAARLTAGLVLGNLVGLSTVVTPTAASAQSAAAQQPQAGRTRISGTVTDVASGQPVVGATVRIVGTAFAASTNDRGEYTLSVPNGLVTVEAQRIGFGVTRRENIRAEGEPLTIALRMNSNPLSLEAVTVSASVDPTSGIKSPYAVSSISAENMPVPTAAAASTALIGKIAGVNIIQADGAPGAGAYVQLRTPSSPFKSNSPLYVVDGVLLNSTQSVTTQDIESMNIESIEVIKGAAAAALYGSRAAGGVISIKTNRGRDLSLGTSQITVRNDMGYDQFYGLPEKRNYHWNRMNDQGQLIDANGAVLPRSQKNNAAAYDTREPFADNPYPIRYDNLGQVFRNGRPITSVVSLTGNSATTNYSVSFTRNRQPGNIIDTYGFLRQGLAFSLDHNIGERLTVGVTGNHTRSNNGLDQVSFGNLYSIDPDIDLTRKDANGVYLPRPDSSSSITNPLYLQQANDYWVRRARTLLSTNFTFRPLGWLSVIGDVGYDRGDLVEDLFTPPGLVDGDNDGVTLGYLEYDQSETDGLSGNLGATAQRAFGDLTARLTAKAGLNRERYLRFISIGENFQVAGVRDLAAAGTKTNSSSTQEERLNSRTLALGLDYKGKYIFDGLLLREGNSLFGPDHRWTNFYRVGGSYLMSDEPWFPKDGVFGGLTTFKLRYNVGTAGTQPDFLDQYSSISIGNAGFVRDNLGNADLRPEIKTDHEAGIDMIIKSRLQVQLTYAKSRTKDAIVAVAVPSITGYNTGEANVGSTSGEVYEATVEGIWKQTRNFTWWSNLVLDRGTSTVNEINRPCYTDGARYYCDGSPLTAFWGNAYARDVSHLRSVHANSQGAFQVNDDGYLVPVGVGNSYTEGVAKGLWGSIVSIDGVQYRWGEPIFQWDEKKGARLFKQIGNGEPDLRFGYGNRFNYKDFQLYFLVNGQFGGQVYNLAKQLLYANNDAKDVEQHEKATEYKKPFYYYSRGIAQSTASSYFDSFVEDGTHAKFGELQLGYQMTAAKYPFIRHVSAERVNVSLLARNLGVWKKSYTGLRPDGGQPNYRVDGTNYPIARNYTASVSVVF